MNGRGLLFPDPDPTAKREKVVPTAVPQNSSVGDLTAGRIPLIPAQTVGSGLSFPGAHHARACGTRWLCPSSVCGSGWFLGATHKGQPEFYAPGFSRCFPGQARRKTCWQPARPHRSRLFWASVRRCLQSRAVGISTDGDTESTTFLKAKRALHSDWSLLQQTPPPSRKDEIWNADFRPKSTRYKFKKANFLGKHRPALPWEAPPLSLKAHGSHQELILSTTSRLESGGGERTSKTSFPCPRNAVPPPDGLSEGLIKLNQSDPRSPVPPPSRCSCFGPPTRRCRRSYPSSLPTPSVGTGNIVRIVMKFLIKIKGLWSGI